jgi:hypothetical protein
LYAEIMDKVRTARAGNPAWTIQLIHPADLDAEVAIRWATLLNDKGHNEFANQTSVDEGSGLKGGLRRLSVAAHISKETEAKPPPGLPGISESGAPSPGGRRESISGRRESISGRRASVSGRRGSIAQAPPPGGLGGIQEDEAGYSGQVPVIVASGGVPSLGKFRVLAKCTVREGKDGDSTKLGEYTKGAIIDVVEEGVNDAGLAVVRSVTALPNGALGGWVKVKTAKGKTQIEKQQGVKSDRRMSITQKNARGEVIAPAEELIDVTFEGSGALGMLFQEVAAPRSATKDIIVKSLVPGSIASDIKDVAPGMILRSINGTDIKGKKYNMLMQTIGNQWRSHQKLVLTFASPEVMTDSEEEEAPEGDGGGAAADKWVDGAAFGSPHPSPRAAADAAPGGFADNDDDDDKSGELSPRYLGTTVWGENVVETALATLLYLGFPEKEAEQALEGKNDVDAAIAKLARITPAQV